MEWLLCIILNGLTMAIVMRVSYVIGSKTGYMKGYKEGINNLIKPFEEGEEPTEYLFKAESEDKE